MELKEEDLIPCEDFNFFEARLTALRKSDDLIAIELNKIDVNSQAECGNIWRKLTAGTHSFPSSPPHPRIHEDELAFPSSNWRTNLVQSWLCRAH